MPADDGRQSGRCATKARPGQRAIGGGGAVVRRLPAPPNARVDGLDARAAGLAAFVAQRGRTLRAAGGRRAREAVADPLRGARPGSAPATCAPDGRRRRCVGGVGRGRNRRVDGGDPPAAPAELHGGWRRAARRTATCARPPRTSRSSPSRTEPISTSCRAPALASLDVGRRGARLMLEDGRAHVQVAHRPGADWQVQAGALRHPRARHRLLRRVERTRSRASISRWRAASCPWMARVPATP